MDKFSNNLIVKDKFIIPPIEKQLHGSEHYQINQINIKSFSRNILFTPKMHKSMSQGKQNLQKQFSGFKSKISKKSMLKQRKMTEQPKMQSFSKFKMVLRQDELMVNWQKWHKRNIDIAGKTFIAGLHKKIQNNIEKSDASIKNTRKIFGLRHKIRQINSLKKSINNTRQNHIIIEKLEEQSNQKIGMFFGQYESMIKQAHLSKN